MGRYSLARGASRWNYEPERPAPERLCFLSRGNWKKIRIPGGVIFEHGIDNDDEFSGAGGKNDLGGLSAFGETICKVANTGWFDMSVMHEIKSGQIDCGSNSGASSEDGSFSSNGATVVAEGGDTNQGSDLLTIELTEFGEFGEDCGTGGWTDAGDALQDFIFTTPVVIKTDESLNLGVDGVDLALQAIENLVDTFASERAITSTAAIDLHGAHGDQLATAHDELFKFNEFFRGFFQRTRFHVLREACQHPGVDPVSLGVLAVGQAKMVGEPGVDNGHDETRRDEFCGETSLEAAGGLHDDERAGELLEVIDERLDTGRVIRQSATGIRRQEEHLEIVLGDGNTHERLTRLLQIIHDRAPALPIRARPRLGAGRLWRLFGLTVWDRRRSSSGTASRAPRGGRSVAGRGCASFFAALRSSHTRYLIRTLVQ